MGSIKNTVLFHTEHNTALKKPVWNPPSHWEEFFPKKQHMKYR